MGLGTSFWSRNWSFLGVLFAPLNLTPFPILDPYILKRVRDSSNLTTNSCYHFPRSTFLKKSHSNWTRNNNFDPFWPLLPFLKIAQKAFFQDCSRPIGPLPHPSELPTHVNKNLAMPNNRKKFKDFRGIAPMVVPSANASAGFWTNPILGTHLTLPLTKVYNMT